MKLDRTMIDKFILNKKGYSLAKFLEAARVASGLLNDLRNAKEAEGILAKSLAGLSFAGSIIHFFSKEVNIESYLLNDYPVEESKMNHRFIEDLLEEFKCNKTEESIEKYIITKYDVGVASVKQTGKDIEWIFFKENVNYAKVCQELVWGKYKSINIDLHTRPSYKYVFTPFVKVDKYASSISVDSLCKRFKKYKENRFVMIMGPTGVGKSTLAYHIGKNYDGARICRISSKLIGGAMDLSEFIFMMQALSPDIFILDDIQTVIGHEATMLQLLDEFKEKLPKTIVIATYMLEPKDQYIVNSKGIVEPGTFYFPGMRPGRIDETVFIPPPDKINRQNILRCYMKEEYITDAVLDKTKGLSGAYLKELATRIEAHGFENWELEADNLFMSSPVYKVAN